MSGPVFTLERFVKRRYNRGVAAAELTVMFAQDETVTLWMSNRDLFRNVALYGECDALTDAMEKYREAAQ